MRRGANAIGTKNNFGLKKFPAEGGVEKRADKNFPSPDPFPFLSARFLGVRGLCPRLSLLNFYFKLPFACVVPWAGQSLTCELNLVK